MNSKIFKKIESIKSTKDIKILIVDSFKKYKKIYYLFGAVTIAVISLLIYFYSGILYKGNLHKIVINSEGFLPQSVSIALGDSVVFVNEAANAVWPASDPHPLHTNYSDFDPQRPVNPGESWTFKPKKAGEWVFHDHLFPSRRGKLTVRPRNKYGFAGRVVKREELVSLLDKNGSEKTYNILKSVYDPSTAIAHTSFHLFGEVLYEESGIQGIELCDNFGGFGCYHGLFINAVGSKGIDVAEELDKKCVEKFGLQGLGCPHGIGHGLVEYFGFGKTKEPLKVCAKLSWKGALFGCSGGVFMENNFPTVFDKDGKGETKTREAHGNMFEPCLSTDLQFKQSCYFEQASWWNEVLRGDYSQIGRFCNSLKKQGEYESCLLGAGNSAAETNRYDKDKAMAKCDAVTGSKSIALCRAGAAWAFFANPEKRAESPALCEGLGVYKSLCLEKRILVN